MEYITADTHRSTKNMEAVTRSMHTIAEKTERETALMHIITVVTLVFLPGTFVAVSVAGLLFLIPPLPLRASNKLAEGSLTSVQTFLGSGLFQWAQNDSTMQFPIWRPEFFALFAKVCFPLMGATILVWLVAYFWSNLRAMCWRQRRSDRDEEEALVQPEK